MANLIWKRPEPIQVQNSTVTGKLTKYDPLMISGSDAGQASQGASASNSPNGNVDPLAATGAISVQNPTVTGKVSTYDPIRVQALQPVPVQNDVQTGELTYPAEVPVQKDVVTGEITTYDPITPDMINQPDPLAKKMYDDYGNAINDMLTGNAYSPFGDAQREAQARAEKNMRAKSSSIINRSGFSGQGIGDQLAEGVESDVLRNRFDNNMQIAQGNQMAKERAIPLANQYTQYSDQEGQRMAADAAAGMDWNTFAQRYPNASRAAFDRMSKGYEQDALAGDLGNDLLQQTIDKYGDQAGQRMAADAATGMSWGSFSEKYPGATREDFDRMSKGYDQTASERELALDSLKSARSGEASGDFAAYVQNHPDLKGKTGAELLQDEGFKKYAQDYWDGLGFEGEVTEGFAKRQADAINDPALNNQIVATAKDIDEAVAEGAITAEMGDKMKKFAQTGMMAYFKQDENGDFFFDWEAAKGGGTTVNVGGEGGDGGETPASTADSWSEFSETIPSYISDSEDFDEQAWAKRWKDSGKPSSYDDLKAVESNNNGGGGDETPTSEFSYAPSGTTFRSGDNNKQVTLSDNGIPTLVDSTGKGVSYSRVTPEKAVEMFKGGGSVNNKNHDLYTSVLDNTKDIDSLTFGEIKKDSILKVDGELMFVKNVITEETSDSFWPGVSTIKDVQKVVFVNLNSGDEEKRSIS